jgi:hypothetical protein
LITTQEHSEFNMRAIKSVILLLFLLGPATASVAHAQHGFYHGPRVGVFVDPWPFFYPYYPYAYYPGYYPQQVVVAQAAPTTYVEQGTPVPAAAAQPRNVPSNDWYYCRKPEGYYPYVRTCTDGWERVPAQPPASR